MHFKITLSVLAAIVLLGIAWVGLGYNKPTFSPTHVGHTNKLTVYKSATCGCCAIWVSYMKNKGYQIEVTDTEQLHSFKEQYDVPVSLYSCHTTIANDGQYFIEGHIPEEAVAKLLTEKPEIAGIGMPGMPSASPGMPGKKLAPFDISQVGFSGKISEYMSI